MKKLTIELEENWVFKHRDDEELPVSVLKTELKKLNGIEVKESSYTLLTLIFDEQIADFGGIKDIVMRLFSERYPEDKTEDILSFQSGEIAGESKEEKEESDETEDGQNGDALEQRRQRLLARLQAEMQNDAEPVESEPDVLEKVDRLVGADEFKRLIKEIGDVSGEIKRANTYEIFKNRCYLFSIGDGCGLSTYLDLFAQVLSKYELCKMAYHPVREERLGAYKEGMEPFEDAVRVLGGGDTSNMKMFCVDVSEWMDKTDNRHFKHFLRLVEKHAEEFIVVFRVPFVDKDVLSRIQYSLSDLLSVKSVSFPPLNQEEIKTYAESEFKRFGFSVTKTAWRYFFERISEEKSDGKFYGVNTVKKVVRDFIYQKQLTNAGKHQANNVISHNDAKALCGGIEDGDLSGMKMLDKLVGGGNIKNRIEEIVAQIELSLRDGSVSRPCIHMRFVGNPGTGKTTVARIIGKILKEKGVLRIGGFFEYAGRDFCGRYIGETAPKTSSICRDAYGSVLFIDEAYSLYRGDADSRDFGREALDTLIAEMENHRNDFVVIMAGYTEDMDKLMSGNLGLASRMPYTIEFPNFTKDQLYEIFVSMLQGKFKYDKELLQSAHAYFTDLPEEMLTSKEFSNARFVRNLYERTWAKAAMRSQLNGKEQIVLTKEDFEHATADKEFAPNLPKKTRIGFNI